jgi:hypothetical protein
MLPLDVDEAAALFITDMQQAGLQPTTYAFAPTPKNRYPRRFCTSSFDVSVEQQLSSERERQINSTRKENTMRFMVIVKVTEDTENEGALPDPQLMADLNKFNDDLLEAGVLIGYDGLHPSSKGARVHFSGKNCTVIDGPFAESKEVIASFWFWQVKSLEEAIEWVKRCPNEGETDIEIRQVFEPEEFASAFSDEEIQQEKNFRARMAANAAKK